MQQRQGSRLHGECVWARERSEGERAVAGAASETDAELKTWLWERSALKWRQGRRATQSSLTLASRRKNASMTSIVRWYVVTVSHACTAYLRVGCCSTTSTSPTMEPGPSTASSTVERRVCNSEQQQATGYRHRPRPQHNRETSSSRWRFVQCRQRNDRERHEIAWRTHTCVCVCAFMCVRVAHRPLTTQPLASDPRGNECPMDSTTWRRQHRRRHAAHTQRIQRWSSHTHIATARTATGMASKHKDSTGRHNGRGQHGACHTRQRDAAPCSSPS